MGQRLVIEFVNNGDFVGSIYFHWSGYTCSALSECDDIIQSLINEPLKTIDKYSLTQRLLSVFPGSGLDEDHQYLATGYNFPNATDRNDGIIGIKSEEDSLCCAEQIIVVDLASETVDISECFTIIEESKVESTPVFLDTVLAIPFKEFTSVAEEIAYEISIDNPIFTDGVEVFSAIY